MLDACVDHETEDGLAEFSCGFAQLSILLLDQACVQSLISLDGRHDEPAMRVRTNSPANEEAQWPSGRIGEAIYANDARPPV